MDSLQVPTGQRQRSQSVGSVAYNPNRLSFSCSDLLSLDSSPRKTTGSFQYDQLSPDVLSSTASATSFGSATKRRRRLKKAMPSVNLLPNKLRFWNQQKNRLPTYPMSEVTSPLLLPLEQRSRESRPNNLALGGMPLRSRSKSVAIDLMVKSPLRRNYSNTSFDEDDEAFSVSHPISIVISSSGKAVDGAVGGNLNSEAYKKFLGKSLELVCVHVTCVCVCVCVC